MATTRRARRERKEKKPAVILRIARHYGWNPGRGVSWALEWVEVLVVAAALALLVINFVTVRMHVPTDSMYPTINGDPNSFAADSFFVDRISYSFRDPRPGDIVVFWHTEAVLARGITANSPAARAGLKKGAQIVSLNREPIFSAKEANALLASLPLGTRIYLGTPSGLPLDLGVKTKGTATLADLGVKAGERRVRYVKRLIATGGQTVQVRDGRVYVNGSPLMGARFDRTYVSDLAGMRYGVEPTLVPQGSWFVLGDNSRDSFDSRYWGFVESHDFIGEPYLRVWPLPRFGPMNGYFHF